MSTSDTERAQGHQRQVPAALPASIVARLAASWSAMAEDWPVQPPEDDTERTSVRVASAVTHDVWLLRWLPGSRVRPHDHGDSVGAFSVVRGALRELRWDADGVTRIRLVEKGETVSVGEGVAHDVVGDVAGSLSVHVYSPPLSSMRFYEGDKVVGEAVVGEEDDVAQGADARRAVSSGRARSAATRARGELMEVGVSDAS